MSLFLAAMLATTIGCGYGAMSAEGYEFAKALYGLSNRQASERLDAVEQQIESAVADGKLPANEGRWLRSICTQCRDGQWEAAQKSCRQMMVDQVNH